MTTDSLEAPPITKAQARTLRVEQQRVDAAKVRTEMEAARVARDEKTARLRALRLAKEAADREAASLVVTKPRKPKKRTRAVAR